MALTNRRNNMNFVNYRLYACGNLVSEDSFAEYDNMKPYYDDYCQVAVPIDIEGEDAVRAYFDEAINYDAVEYYFEEDRITAMPEVMTVPYGSLNILI